MFNLPRSRNEEHGIQVSHFTPLTLIPAGFCHALSRLRAGTYRVDILQGTKLRSPVRGAREMGLEVVAMARLSCTARSTGEMSPGRASCWGCTSSDAGPVLLLNLDG
jgi:hypothetical protein